MEKTPIFNENVYNLTASDYVKALGHKLFCIQFRKCKTKKGPQYKALIKARFQDGKIRTMEVWPHDFADATDLERLTSAPVTDILLAFGTYEHEVLNPETGEMENKVECGRKWVNFTHDGKVWDSFTGGSIPFEVDEAVADASDDDTDDGSDE